MLSASFAFACAAPIQACTAVLSWGQGYVINGHACSNSSQLLHQLASACEKLFKRSSQRRACADRVPRGLPIWPCQYQATLYEYFQQLAGVARVSTRSLSQTAQVVAFGRVRQQHAQNAGFGLAAKKGDEWIGHLLCIWLRSL